MGTMISRLSTIAGRIAVAVLLVIGSVPAAQAQGHGHVGGWHGGHGGGRGGGHVGFGWGVGLWAPFYWGAGWPYYYGYPAYGPPVYYAPPVVEPTVVQPAGPAPAPVWYYCDNPQGYYPYVQSCSSAWRQVPATPPAQTPAAKPAPH